MLLKTFLWSGLKPFVVKIAFVDYSQDVIITTVQCLLVNIDVVYIDYYQVYKYVCIYFVHFVHLTLSTIHSQGDRIVQVVAHCK